MVSDSEFKKEAARMLLEDGLGISEVFEDLGITGRLPYRCNIQLSDDPYSSEVINNDNSLINWNRLLYGDNKV